MCFQPFSGERPRFVELRVGKIGGDQRAPSDDDATEQDHCGPIDVSAEPNQSGGSEPIEAKDYGFMYQRGFQDIDGHLWEVVHMDEGKMPGD